MTHSMIGLDIGSRWVKAAQWFRSAGRARLRSASFPRQAPGTPFGEDEARRIASVLARRGFAGESVTLIAPAERARIAEIEVPAASAGAGRAAVARMELARVCRLEPASFEFEAWEVQRTVRSGEAPLAVALLPHADADVFVLPLAEAGLVVESIRTVGEACGEMLRGATGTIDTFADIGSSGLSLSVLVGGVCVYERRLVELGMDAVAKSAEEILRIDAQGAQRALHAAVENSSGRAHAAMAGVLRSFGARIGDELAVSLEYASHRYTQAAEGRVVALGGGACLPALLTAAGQTFGIAVEAARTPAASMDECFVPRWPVVAVAAMAVAPRWAGEGGMP